MISSKVEIKKYSRKGIIKNTEWIMKKIEGMYIMNIKFKIKEVLINIRPKIKSYIKMVSRNILNNDIDRATKNQIKILNLNEYEKYKTEIIFQMHTGRKLY